MDTELHPSPDVPSPSSREEMPSRVGKPPRKTAASSTSSRHSPPSASRRARRSTTKASPTRSAKNCSQRTACSSGSIRFKTAETARGLDALLRDVAAQGVWVSAHPDVILKMGTKEVLYRTRAMGWGSRHGAVSNRRGDARRAADPARHRSARDQTQPGQWRPRRPKVEKLPTSSIIKVLDATKEAPEELTLDDFLRRCAEYFENGSVIDQAFQPRLSEGVVRCYMAGDRCAGFGHHKVKALIETPAARSEAGPRLDTPNADPRFQQLRRLMEDEWTPQLTSLLEIARDDLPAIWDADFMLGPVQADGSDSYVLGEINVSSVHPYPNEAPAEIARRIAARLQLKL